MAHDRFDAPVDGPVYDVTFLTPHARRALVVLSTCLGLVLGAFGWVSPASAATDTGVLRVEVTNRSTGGRVAGVAVEVRNGYGSESIVVVVTTGADGTVTQSLPQGYYSVCPRRDLVTEVSCGYPQVFAGQTATVGVTSTPDPMTQRGTLTGVVTDQNGAGLSGVRVSVRARRNNRFAEVTTAGNGAWSLPARSDDSYYVEIDDTNDFQGDGGSSATVSPGGTVRVDLEVERYAHVRGVVTGPDGSTLPGIDVAARSMNRQGEIVDGRRVRTAADGSYDLGLYAGSDVRLFFRDPTGFYRSEYHSDAATFRGATVTTTRLDQPRTINASLARASSIAGQVTAGGYRPIVRALNPDGSVASRARVREDGSYSVNGLAAGTYAVDFARVSGYSRLAAEFFDNKAEAAGRGAATPVTVGAAATTGNVNATLDLGGRIFGRLLDANRVPLRCQVQAFTADGSLTTRSARTGRDGVFSIAGLSTGNYLLRVLQTPRSACDLGDQVYVAGSGGALSGDPSAASPVRVVKGGDQQLPNDLTYTRGSVLSGTVSASGVDRGTTEVIARDTAGKVAGSAHVNLRNGTGHFNLNGLAAGTYTVAFNRLSGYSAQAAQFFSGVAEGAGRGRATRVRVGTTTTRSGIDARLALGGSITGRVTGTSVSYQGCLVQAFRADRSMVTRTGRVESDGRFVVPGLSTGAYKLRVVGGGRCRAGTQYYTGGPALGQRSSSTLINVVVGRVKQVGSLTYGTKATITGKVSGVSAYGTLVVVRDSAGEVAATTRAFSDDGGGAYAYSVSGLAAGTYTVAFNRLSGFSAAAAQRWDRRQEGLAGTPIMVDTNEVKGSVNAALVSGGRITGQLVDSAGRGMHCTLQAYTANGVLVTRAANTAENGSFEIGGLSTGQYLVRVVPSDDCVRSRYVVNGSSLSASATDATPVSVRLGVSTALTAPLVYSGATGSGPTPGTDGGSPSGGGSPTSGTSGAAPSSAAAAAPVAAASACVAANAGVVSAQASLTSAQAKVKSASKKVKKAVKARAPASKIKKVKKAAKKAKSRAKSADTAVSAAQAAARGC